MNTSQSTLETFETTAANQVQRSRKRIQKNTSYENSKISEQETSRKMKLRRLEKWNWEAEKNDVMLNLEFV